MMDLDNEIRLRMKCSGTHTILTELDQSRALYRAYPDGDRRMAKVWKR